MRKSDGGYGYPATDLAAMRHRTGELGATRLLYVVGLPQRQHFAMVFAVAGQAGWLRPPARAEHVGFGSVLGADGRMLRSRAGGSVKLVDLLDGGGRPGPPRWPGARTRRWTQAAAAEIGRAVGIGAIKYADLSTDRTKDYVLRLGPDARARRQHRALPAVRVRPDPVDVPAGRHAGPGRTAPIVLAAAGRAGAGVGAARLRRRGRRGGADAWSSTSSPATCTGWPARSPRSTSAARCCGPTGAVRASRLLLCDLTARTLRQGLHLLGIRTVERM